jgi:hypothetical protein
MLTQPSVTDEYRAHALQVSGRVAGWLAGWLAGWSVGRSVGQYVASFYNYDLV